MFICESRITWTWQFKMARASTVTFEFKLDPVFGVYEVRVAAVHCLISDAAQLDQKPELVVGVDLRQIHVLCFVFCLGEEAAGLRSNDLAFDAVVEHHVGHADFCGVGV